MCCYCVLDCPRRGGEGILAEKGTVSRKKCGRRPDCELGEAG